MSEFKYQWQVGDKAYYLDKKGSRRNVFIVSGGSSRQCYYILKQKRAKKWIKHKDGALIVFQERVNLQPRGKRTIEKYAAANKAKWEAEQVVEFAVGDYLISKGSDTKTVFKIKKLSTVNRLAWVDEFATNNKFQYPYFYLEHFRRATPEEIKEATRTVWNLEDGDECYMLCQDGYICEFQWSENTSHEKWRNRGAVFLTKEAAEAADQKRVDDFAREKGA